MSAAGPPDADPLLSEMRATILALHSSSESSFSHLSQIAAFSSRLRDGVLTVRAGFSAGAIFAQTVEAVRASLLEISTHAGLPHRGVARPVAPSGLDEYTAHYTMEAERKVYHAVTAGPARALPAKPSAPGVPSGEDLGDNVELF